MRKEEKNAFRRHILSGACGVGIALAVFGSAALAQEAGKPAGPQATPVGPAPQATKPAPTAAAPAAAAAHAPAAMPEPPGAEEMADGEEFFYDEPLQVGDATQDLLAWQRSGEIASTTPRPITGNVANRSYERYLKSFEFPIPERMTSSVKSSASGSGSGSAAAR